MNLPELTDEERTALESLDMTQSLGTLEERLTVATRAAIRWMRKCKEKDAEIKRLDEAQAAARWLFANLDESDTFDIGGYAEKTWPWLSKV